MMRLNVALMRLTLMLLLAVTDGPTLEDIRRWPAAVSVARASRAYGFSRSHGYELAARGEFPAKTILAGRRLIVVTADIVRQLSSSERGTDAA